MFDNCFLSFKEKLILFIINIKPIRLSVVKRRCDIDSLLNEYKFLEIYFPNLKPPVIKVSKKGKMYIRYRREKRQDALIVPLVVSVSAAVITSLLLRML